MDKDSVYSTINLLDVPEQPVLVGGKYHGFYALTSAVGQIFKLILWTHSSRV